MGDGRRLVLFCWEAFAYLRDMIHPHGRLNRNFFGRRIVFHTGTTQWKLLSRSGTWKWQWSERSGSDLTSRAGSLQLRSLDENRWVSATTCRTTVLCRDLLEEPVHAGTADQAHVYLPFRRHLCSEMCSEYVHFCSFRGLDGKSCVCLIFPC